MKQKNWSKVGQSGNLRKKLFRYRGQSFNGAKPGKPKMHLRKRKKTVVCARVSKGKNGSGEDRKVMGSQTAETFTRHCEEFGFYSKGNQELQRMFLGRNLYFTIWVLC